jgi:hypothetical protein
VGDRRTQHTALAHERAEEVLDRPQQGGPRAALGARVDLVEETPQAPVAKMREAVEVERAAVHLADEAGLRVDESVLRQHSVHLGSDALRVDHAVERRRNHDGVEGAVGERQVVPVADDIRAGPEGEARLDHL